MLKAIFNQLSGLVVQKTSGVAHRVLDVMLHPHKNKLQLAIVGLSVYALTTTWGYWHYHQEFGRLSQSMAMGQVSEFERQKTSLVARIATLESALERTERFTQRLESSIGVESGKLNKGVGPVSEQEDFAEFLKRVHKMPKLSADSLRQDYLAGKLDEQFYGKLNLKLDQLSEYVGSLEQRINEVYVASQDKTTFWSSTPSQWPVQGWITSEFGMRLNPFGGYRFHEGLDIAAPVGSPIVAPSDGIVVSASYLGGYGNCVVIDHGYGITTKFAHASALYVSEGQRITRGQAIAAVGSTGSSTGPHLHYEVKVDGVPTNPMNFIFNN